MKIDEEMVRVLVDFDGKGLDDVEFMIEAINTRRSYHLLDSRDRPTIPNPFLQSPIQTHSHSIPSPVVPPKVIILLCRVRTKPIRVDIYSEYGYDETHSKAIVDMPQTRPQEGKANPGIDMLSEDEDWEGYNMVQNHRMRKRLMVEMMSYWAVLRMLMNMLMMQWIRM